MVRPTRSASERLAEIRAAPRRAEPVCRASAVPRRAATPARRAARRHQRRPRGNRRSISWLGWPTRPTASTCCASSATNSTSKGMERRATGPEDTRRGSSLRRSASRWSTPGSSGLAATLCCASTARRTCRRCMTSSAASPTGLVELVAGGRGRAILSLPTGAGKTRVAVQALIEAIK